MAGRSQHGVSQKKLPPLRRRAVGWEVLGRYAPRVSGNSFHRALFDLNVAELVSRPQFRVDQSHNTFRQLPNPALILPLALGAKYLDGLVWLKRTRRYVVRGVRPSSGAAGLSAGEIWQSSRAMGVET